VQGSGLLPSSGCGEAGMPHADLLVLGLVCVLGCGFGFGIGFGKWFWDMVLGLFFFDLVFGIVLWVFLCRVGLGFGE
jgi:hypothetical protein